MRPAILFGAVATLCAGCTPDANRPQDRSGSAAAETAEEDLSQASNSRLLELAGHEEYRVRMDATKALQAKGPSELGPEDVPALREAINEKWSRHVAIELLGQMGAEANEAAPDLVALFDEPDQGTRKRAALAVVAIQGPEATAAVPVLIDLMAFMEPYRRGPIARVRKFEPRPELIDAATKVGQTAMPELLTGLKHDNSICRKGVFCVLGNLGPAAKEAVPSMIDVVKYRGVHRHPMADLLGNVVPEQKHPAIPAEILAILSIDPEAGSDLTKALMDPDKDVQDNVKIILAMMGETELPADSEAWAKLVEIISNPKGEAARQHREQKRERQFVKLMESLKDEDLSIRREAADQLAEMGSDVIPRIEEAFSDEPPETRQSVGQLFHKHAIRNTGGESKRWEELVQRMSIGDE